PILPESLFYGRVVLQPSPAHSLHSLATRFPELHFVALHGCGSWILQAAEAVRSLPNVALDLSFTLHRYGATSLGTDLRFLMATFDTRLIFGSDFPEIGIPMAK